MGHNKVPWDSSTFLVLSSKNILHSKLHTLILNTFDHVSLFRKWHLGYSAWEYTPTYRGFDSFHGFYGGLQYYFSHMECMNIDCYFDLRINEEEDTVNAQAAQYGTFLERDQALEVLAQEKDSADPFFLYLGWQASHIPNEAPLMYRQLYPDAKHEDRNYAQAQTTALDGSIGEVVAYLKTNGMWDDTLIVFSSDNGGQYNRHDNSPLRGFKNTSFEGGIRVPAFVTGGYLNEERRGWLLLHFPLSLFGALVLFECVPWSAL